MASKRPWRVGPPKVRACLEFKGPNCVTDTLACQATPPAQRQMSGAAADTRGYAVVQQFGQCAVGRSRRLAEVSASSRRRDERHPADEVE